MANFELVSRKSSKARIAMTGPSGAGKTLSALYLAYGITGDWKKIALIDTEHERGRFYADRSDLGTEEFLYASLTPPYSAERYIDFVNSAAEAVGKDGVVIVDSFSHAWDNEGGVLDYKSEVAKRAGKNDYTAWDEAGKVQNNLVNTILSTDCHIIITMRSKMAYAMEQNDRGKMVPVKLGLAPVQRENTEYEFDIVFQISRDHTAVCSKDTTFLDTFSGVITSELGGQLRNWLSESKEPPRCTVCGKAIVAAYGKTAEELATASTAKFGKVMCVACAKREVNNGTTDKS